MSISGRVDAAEANNLQTEAMAQIEQFEDIESIIIDASQLTFISSLGLRVILFLKKKYDDLRIIGACPDVYNVFKITGFHKIIPIEKALDSVSIEGCNLVEGFDNVYQMTEDTVIKVYPKGTTKDDVDREIAMTKECFVLGIPAAMAFDPVMVDGNYALMCESTTPAQVKGIALGKMLRKLHENKVDPDENFPSSLTNVKEEVKALDPYLGSDAVDRLLRMLSVLPDATSILHGNLTLTNIRNHDQGLVFTNLGKAGYGHPVLDLARLYSSFSEEQRGEYFDEMLDEYFDLESYETIKRNRENIVILSQIFDFTSLIANGEPSDQALQQSKQDFQERIVDRWEEILSRLRFKMDFNEEIRKLERKKFYLDGDVDIDWIAKKLGTNRHYVSDYFNKVLHTSFNDYINSLRLDYAAQLLREGKVQKSQVCYDAGFNNDHTFRRLFKQTFGCLPTQYVKD